jgi:CheY-like chemotaxis protein
MPDPAASAQVMCRVLVVEDDYLLADMLNEVLTHDNCTTEVAANGMEALEKLRGGDFDVVVCDLMMPRLDGEALYNEVARQYPYLANRFLFMTGQASRRGGFSDFIYRTGNTLLEKPFELDQFREALREVLAR